MASVYICGSHMDREWRDRLKLQLKVLERNGLITIWDDEIDEGDDRAVLTTRLNEADMVVLLVTAAFLVSDAIMDEQLPIVMGRRQKEGMRVFPIIVKPCTWRDVPWLSSMQVAPRNGEPLAKGSDYEVEETLAGIASQIHKLAKKAGSAVKPASGLTPPAPVAKPTSPTPIPAAQPRMDNEVFISYAWGGDSEDLVNRLDKAFQDKGITIVRDKRDLGFKGRIKGFMERIGKGSCVIVVISDKYLRSENCMFELIQISEAGNFADRIFPIVLSDAAGIYKAVKRVGYIRYWEEQIEEVNEAIRSLGSSANLQEIHAELDLYTEVRRLMERLMSVLKDMNTLTPDIHSESGFDEIFQAVSAKLNS